MGGKEKKGQRTKGNVRPSSSAKAAELLEKTGGGTFVGFGAMGSDLGYVPTFRDSEDAADSSVDSQFRMVLRKLSKRDSTTKIKALQEFSALCKEKDADTVTSVLPYWPRIYNKIAIDHDRRVREATQQAMAALVSAVGRGLAPHLRALMGCWAASLCDPHAPVASAARQALLLAFPSHAKQTEALAYCREAIIAYVQDNLFTQTAQTLSDPKTTDKEDMESKYEKVLASNLGALRLLLTSIPTEQQKSIVPSLQEILANPKFWKLAKHSTNTIRAAFYSAVSAFCQVHPALANEQAAKICPLVLHNLDETEPLIGPALWEAVLYAVIVIEEWWSHINPRKGMLPKLWSLFRQGGGGSAAVIFPNLLPLLSKLPEHIIGEGLGFYQEFFNNLRTGLSSEKVQASPSELNAVTKAFFECAVYLTTQNITSNTELCLFLALEQIVPLLEASITESSQLSNAVHPLFINYLTHLLHVTKDTNNQPIFDQVWAEFTKLCIRYLNTEDMKILQRFGDLLTCFSSGYVQTKTKPSKVKFTEDLSEPLDKINVTPKDSKVSSLLSSAQVQDLLCQLYKETYAKSKSDKNSEHFLRLFANMSKHFLNEGLMMAVSESEGYEGFAESVVLPLMKEYEGKEGLCKVVAHIVVVFMAVYKDMEAAQKVAFLEKALKSLSDPSLLHPLLLAVTPSADPSVLQWLGGREFGAMAVRWVQGLCRLCLGGGRGDGEEAGDGGDGAQGEKKAYWGLLRIALNSGGKLPLVGEQYIEEILREIEKALPSPSAIKKSTADVITCVSFVCEIATEFFSNYKGCLLLESAENLLLALFTLSCRDDHSLSPALMGRIEASWRLGVKAVLHQKGGLLTQDSFLMKAALHLRNLVLCDAHTVTRIEKLAGVAISLAESMSQVLEPEEQTFSNPTIQELFCSQLFLPFSHNRLPEWASGAVMSGSVFLEQCPPPTKIQPTTVPVCMAPICFSAAILVAMDNAATSTNQNKDDNDDTTTNQNTDDDTTTNQNTDDDSTTNQSIDDGKDGDDEKEEASKSLSAVEEAVVEERRKQREELTMDVAYACALGNALLGVRKESFKSTELGKATQLLEVHLNKLLKQNPTSVITQLVKRSLTDGHLWSHAAALLLGQVKGQDVLSLYGGADRFSSLDLPMLHSLGALLERVTKDEAATIAELQAAQIMSLPKSQILIDGARHLYLYNRSLERVPPTPDVAVGVLAALYEWRQDEDNDNLFIFDSDVREVTWPVVCLNVECMRLMQLLVQHIPQSLNDKHWDFILCTLTPLVNSVEESKAALERGEGEELAAQHFTRAVCELVASVAARIAAIAAAEDASAYPETLATDWSEFFCPTIYATVFGLYVRLAESLPSPVTSLPGHLLLSSVAAAASDTPLSVLLAHSLSPKLVAEDEGEALEASLLSLLNHLTGLLGDGRYSVQMAAFHILDRLMPEISEANEKQKDEDVGKSDDGSETKRSPCRALLSALDVGAHVVELVLQDTLLGECMLIEPGIAEYTLTTAYLLAWKLLLTLFKAASSELRAQYAGYLRSLQAVDGLILNLFRLMPDPPCAEDSGAEKNMFLVRPKLSVQGSPSSASLQQLACHVYYKCLEDVPAIIRQCWAAMDKKTAGIIDKFTTRYVSGLLSGEELRAVNTSQKDMENMTVKVLPQAREVIATYVVDEVCMDLTITLAANHPLGNICVNSERRVGVPQTQWRNWMMQLHMYLTLQNGTILDGLVLWKQNVDKRFEGVDDCMICFSVIHATTCQLPRLQCRTCKKRFHSPCLYKWFNTSNNSSCPLCRNLF